ncbi:Histamine N-methyltransferase A [Dissostichus eleginoides]|uniref:Histamine N-methyltransferase A n=1 Tax=Dissostichus eleginoides TaxID=100907 RepID=A0AAD9CIY7_DISEL|nr:Histamine N-methyltransferase A [Dissostichus eleginoides]
MDTQMLTLLQSTFPAVQITADIVEGSSKLTDNFKALVAKTANLQNISFAWHLMNSEDYERQVKAKGDMKTFDFIHMIQMIYYVDNLADTIRFYHSMLKNNGRLMIIVAATNCGSDTLWKAYKKELWVDSITDWRSPEEVIVCLKSLGLKYEEHAIPNAFDISECFNPNSQIGEHLLNFITSKDHFYQSFTPEIRAGMLDVLRTKCSTEKEGGESVMAAEAKQTCYEGSCVQSFQFYLEHSGEHEAIMQCVHNVLPGEFQRIGAGKSSLDVLGVGSGGGEMDSQMLTLLQSTFPAVPISADIVEGSSKLTDNFKASVAKIANLQKIPFGWHIMHSEDYEKQVKAKGDVKKFDFIHMIQMIYYVDNLAGTIKFFQSLLKNNGRLMIIIEAANSGWDTLWKTYKKDLCVDAITEYRSSGEIIACLKSLGLKYDEHTIPNSFNVSECFIPSSQLGQRLLNFLTAKDHFNQSFTPEIRAGMLDLLRNKCSTEKDGKVLFNSTLKCILVHA